MAEDIAAISYSEQVMMERQLQLITSTIPSATSGRQKRQLGIIFSIAGTLFGLFNYINTPEYNEQNTKNKHSVSAVKIQEDHLCHLDFEVEANKRHII